MQIADRAIGPDAPTFVVAELGGNAHKDYEQARALIRAAKEAGADAAKVQVFDADEMSLDVDQPSHRLTWHGREYTLHALYAETAMPLAWHAPLADYARSLGLCYFGSVFSERGIAVGEAAGFPAWKIASFEANDYPLIRAVTATGKPVLISTGLLSEKELGETIWAVEAVREEFSWEGVVTLDESWPLAFLICTTAYPAPVSAANLRTLADLPACVRGLSDHTRNNAVVAAAVALGARIVERHLTLDRSLGGPDAPFSDEPHEFAAMVQAIRDTEAALGSVHYGPTEAEAPMLRYRRSVWCTADIAPGEPFAADTCAVLRPTGGLEPGRWDWLLTRRATRAIRRGEPISEDMVGV